MDEYISRPKMLSELRGGFFPQDVVYTEAVAIAKQIIESAPAEEDVVRVVRCEKCKYAEVVTDILGTPMLFCTLPGRNFPKVHGEEFCSSGKRKTE